MSFAHITHGLQVTNTTLSGTMPGAFTSAFISEWMHPQAPGVELSQVMLEMQKANVSFRALTEVRNKFVEAYREIMNMPL